MENYNFCGWATKANIKCSDGRTIMKDAFKHNDGAKVPLVWNHQHDDPDNILGYAILKNRDEGVYAYGYFNDSDSAKAAKTLVEHGDIDSLSIYANQLKEKMNCVTHGNIREVSLVLAGANIGAHIENVIAHSDGSSDDEEAYIYAGEDIMLAEETVEAESKEELAHADNTENNKGETKMAEETKKQESDKTVQEVWDTLNEEQKTVVYALIGQAIEDNKSESNKEGEEEMKHNLFENDTEKDTLKHSEAMGVILGDAKRFGSLKESYLQHADDYGINQIDWLFPEPKADSPIPEFIKRDTGWVPKVMAGVSHSPFSRIKSLFADITEDDARARGYIKGKMKKEEVFSLLKRTTTPTTVYKKQKMDRDDLIDITDFDVVSWLKGEMRMMLDEELARAYLIGDGRLSSSDDKINESNIRPIYNDEDLYTIKSQVNVANGATSEEIAKAFINTVIKSRKSYKGSGNPTLFTTEDFLTDMLLIEDSMGHKIYKTVEELATALRVKEIVTVEVMEGMTGTKGGTLMGIIVNLKDYKVGADKGGAVNMFDDFDIDYNQQKYLIETRCSGALVKPYSAIALELNEASA